MKNLRCIQGNDYFTAGRLYSPLPITRLAVFDDDNDPHDIDSVGGQYKSCSSAGGHALFCEEITSPVEFTPEFTVDEAQPWDGEGAPPVGLVVEYNIDDDDYDDDIDLHWQDGDKVEILAYRCIGSTEVAVCWNITRKDASQRKAVWHNTSLFRPAKTEAEKEREKLMDIICTASWVLDKDACIVGKIADAVITSDWRKS